MRPEPNFWRGDLHTPRPATEGVRAATLPLCAMAALTLTLFTQAIHADEGNWFERAGDRLSTIYREGGNELYLPLHTYHMRFAYSAEKINSFQENTFGLGIGRGLYDRDGDWHGIYAMGFQDSHFKPEWMTGYGFKTFWHPGQDWKIGAGYTVFLMTRGDIGSYTPFPGILPVASVSYRKLSVETAFVPGGRGYGNILFFWGKYEFKR